MVRKLIMPIVVMFSIEIPNMAATTRTNACNFAVARIYVSS